MYNELLPIGSVVQVKGAKREFMICGRVVARSWSDEVCVYRGYESQEEYDFKENVLAPLDEVEVVDGKIVPKK